MSTALAITDSDLGQASELTAAEWAQLLGITKKAFILRRVGHSHMVARAGGLTKVYPFSALPPDYQATLETLRRSQGVWSFADLRAVRAVELRSWDAPKEIGTLPPASQEKAKKVRAVMEVYFAAAESMTLGAANTKAQAKWLELFGEACNEKTIRRWADKIEARGGPEFAPLEAYADNKSVPHVRARLTEKLSISPDFLAEFRCRCVDAQSGGIHISAALHSLKLDWQNGRPIPGLGVKPASDAAFPFTYHQLRPYAPAKAARVAGHLGKAAAARDALAHGTQTTARLRRMELVLLDDSRVDIIATDDLTGRPVELKSYWLMDVATRRIEGFLLREAGSITAADVDALLARVLRSTGLPTLEAGYHCTIRFERGTVACSPAKETFLCSAFPSRLHIDRTGIDGGRNFPGDHVQASSGRWMDKAHIESFMRTLAFSVQHLPGQRGGNYARQPAALGLVGKNRATGALDYTRGSAIHDAALLQGAERALAFFEGDLDARAQAAAASHEWVNGRLQVRSLYPVSWVRDALKEFTAWFNTRTEHRMEGFRRIEWQDPATGKLRWRMESPNERAAWLEAQAPGVRAGIAPCLAPITPSAVSQLLMRARKVTVGRNGVFLDCAPYRRLRFWRENSIVCRQAGLLTTGAKEYVALVDEEAIRMAHGPEGLAGLEIYLLGNRLEKFQAGERAQFIEALPLAQIGDISDPHQLAGSLEAVKRERERLSAEMLTAAAPALAARLASERGNLDTLRAVVTTNSAAVEAAQTHSPLLAQLADARAGHGPDDGALAVPDATPSRHAQMRDAETDFAASIAAQLAAQSGDED